MSEHRSNRPLARFRPARGLRSHRSIVCAAGTLVFAAVSAHAGSDRALGGFAAALPAPLDGPRLAIGSVTPRSTDESAPSETLGDTMNAASDGSAVAYASAGSRQWWFEFGAGADFDDGWIGFGSVGVEWYVADGFAVGFRLDLTGIETAEMADSAFGGGPAFSMRWHFLRRETWSLFGDASIGLLWTDRDVPDGGSELNFTPRIGIGATFALNERTRLLAAVGWAHVSNAQTSGFNPGFDALRANVGLTFSF